MIAGRSANLYLGLASAAIALVWGVAAATGTPFPPELAAVVLAFIGSVIALLAGSDTLAVRKGDAAARRLAARRRA